MLIMSFCARACVVVSFLGMGIAAESTADRSAEVSRRNLGAEKVVPVRPPSRCEEGEPCWSWSKMGNKRRGVVLTYGGGRRVVSPRGFCKLDRSYRIDWHETPVMKGDAYARSLCPVVWLWK